MHSTDSSAGEPPDARDEQVAALLAAGRTEVEVAADLGVSRSTVQRAARKPAVRRMVRDVRWAAAAAAASLLAGAARDAVAQLVALSKTGTKDDGVKLRACVALVRLTFDDTGRQDLQDELEELRALIETRGEGEPPAAPADLDP